VPTLDTVILTRESPDNRRIAAHLPPGLVVHDYPCVATRLITPEEKTLDSWLAPVPDALVITSKRAVEALAPCASLLRRVDPPVAVVGAATARAVEAGWGITPTWLPSEPTGLALASVLTEALPRGAHVLYLRGNLSTGELADALLDGDLRCEERVVYENAAPAIPPVAFSGLAVAAFASPSAAARFQENNPDIAPRIVAVAAGPTTEAALQRGRFAMVRRAAGPGPEAMARCILDVIGGRDMRRDRSRELFEQARRRIPGGVNSPVRAFGHVGGTPVYFASAEGSRVVDADGNRYVDFCQSWGPLILGHAREEVVAAVQKAAPRGLSYGAVHEGEITLAGLILDGFPKFDRVRAVSSGTEAVMTALRLARGATDRDLVVKFAGGYHGHVDTMLVQAGSGLATHAISSSAGVPEALAATTLVARLDDEASVEALFNAHGDRIAAVIIEPMPANNGLLLQRRDFLGFLREITAHHRAMLIFDEVISGFRLRYGGYCHEVGITPDLVTLGKIIGGGMPIGAVVGPAALMDRLSPLGPVYQAGTLSGNPVSLAAGIKTLEILRDEDPYPRLDALGAALEERLEAGGKPAARAVRRGSIVWLHLDPATFPRNPDDIANGVTERFKGIYGALLERGFYLPPASVEVLFVSAAHSVSEVTALADAVVDLLD